MENRTGRISLRVTPALHAELSDIAETLGVDLNAMLNMMIRESYHEMKSRAQRIKNRERYGSLGLDDDYEAILKWQAENPLASKAEVKSKFAELQRREEEHADPLFDMTTSKDKKKTRKAKE